MTKATVLLVILCALAGCDDPAPTNKQVESQKAMQAANSIKFTENAEIENIKHRLELTANPGLLGFILLLNEAGQPILYEGVRGKITSSTKRLTPPDYHSAEGLGNNNYVRAAASDEGTFGTSDPYIYYWNTDGVYRQWSGKYLYSDQPIRLRVEPLIVNVQSTAAK